MQPVRRLKPLPINPAPSLLAFSALIAALLTVGIGLATVSRLVWLVTTDGVPLNHLLERLLHDDRLLRAFTTTIRVTALALTVQIGVPLLLVRFVRSLSPRLGLFFLLPMLIPASTASLAFFLWFSPAIGPMNSLLGALNLETPLWFVDTAPMTFLAVAVDSWQWLPFVTVVLLYQLGRVPRSVFDQAYVEGASDWQVWRKVTVPSLMPTILVLFAIRLLELVRLHDIVFVLFGRGGPGNSMETLSIYSLKLTFQPGNEAYGALVALSYLFFSFIVLVMVLKIPYLRNLLPWQPTRDG